MKQITYIILLALLGACTSMESKNKLQIPNYPLSKAFDSFSTGPDLILVEISNQLGDKEVIIIENPDWKSTLDEIYESESSIEEYKKMMLNHRNTPFQLPNKAFKQLAKENSAELLEKHKEYQGKGRSVLFKKFMINNGLKFKSGVYHNYWFDNEVSNEKELRSLARVFIESGINVSRDCESGYLRATVHIPNKVDRKINP